MKYDSSTKRAVAVIIQNNQILLMHRINESAEYYVFPGGSVEENEEPLQTVVRELQEEFCIEIKVEKELFQITNTLNDRTRREFYYLVKNFIGTPILGGEEKTRMTDQDQYAPKWILLSELSKLILYPEKAKQKIIELFTNAK